MSTATAIHASRPAMPAHARRHGVLLVGDTRFLTRDGGYWTAGNVRLPLVEALGRAFSTVRIAVRVREASAEEWAAVPPRDVIRVPNVEFVHLPTWNGPRGWFAHRREVKAILDRAIRAVDACVARVPSPPATLAVDLAKRAGVPVATHVLGDPLASWIDWVHTAPLRKGVAILIRRQFERTLRTCDRVLSTSRGVVAPYVPDTTGVTTLADTSLTDADFMPPRPAGAGEVVFFSASRLIPLKNVELFLRGMRQAAAEGLACRCVLAGDGPDMARLRGVARELDLADRVEFLGQVRERDRLRDLYQRAGAGFLLSRNEGLPLGVIESMAAGLPLVLSDIPQCHEAAGDTGGAIYVPADDADRCAQAIVRLVSSAEVRAGMAELNLARAREFHVDAQAARLAMAVASMVD
jgi:glycosyltransferase involved in cell wall biosynthesis